MVEWVQQIWPSKQDSVETVFMSTVSLEQLEMFPYNSKKVFDVYISKVYPVRKMKWTLPSKLKLRDSTF